MAWESTELNAWARKTGLITEDDVIRVQVFGSSQHSDVLRFLTTRPTATEIEEGLEKDYGPIKPALAGHGTNSLEGVTADPNLLQAELSYDKLDKRMRDSDIEVLYIDACFASFHLGKDDNGNFKYERLRAAQPTANWYVDFPKNAVGRLLGKEMPTQYYWDTETGELVKWK